MTEKHNGLWLDSNQWKSTLNIQYLKFFIKIKEKKENIMKIYKIFLDKKNRPNYSSNINNNISGEKLWKINTNGDLNATRQYQTA